MIVPVLLVLGTVTDRFDPPLHVGVGDVPQEAEHDTETSVAL